MVRDGYLGIRGDRWRRGDGVAAHGVSVASVRVAAVRIAGVHAAGLGRFRLGASGGRSSVLPHHPIGDAVRVALGGVGRGADGGLRLHGQPAQRGAPGRVDEGRTASAIDVGLGAVSVDPLRETAQCALIQAHLADGNLSEAVREYRSYARLLRQELGVEPSPKLAALVPEVASAGMIGRMMSRSGSNPKVPGRRPRATQ